MTLESIARGREELVTASPDSSVQELARQMGERNVGSVIIVEGDEPAGIVTDRDLSLKVVGEGKAPADLTAADVMNHDLVTVDVDAGVYEVCETMSEHGVRRLPVTDGDELVGILTLDDLVILLEDEMHDISEVIRSEIPAYPSA